MEYVDGETLFEHIERATPAATLHRWTSQLADAFEYLHRKKLQHRDVKSHNIMVSKDGSAVKVIDLGLATVVKSQASKSSRSGRGGGVGSPAYASKEKHDGGRFGTPDDMWGIGCVLVELGVSSNKTKENKKARKATKVVYLSWGVYLRCLVDCAAFLVGRCHGIHNKRHCSLTCISTFLLNHKTNCPFNESRLAIVWRAPSGATTRCAVSSSTRRACWTPFWETPRRASCDRTQSAA